MPGSSTRWKKIMPTPRALLFLVVSVMSTVALASPPTEPATANPTASASSTSEPGTRSPSTPFGDARDTKAWSDLSGIAGTWAIAQPTSDAQRAFRVSYRLLPNAAALVETYGDPSGRFTQTVFHPDGHRIIATHYCAQGNQPRLQLTATDGPLDFTFFDVTNLASPGASHLTHLHLRAEGDTLTRRETYTSANGDAVDTLELRRVD